MALPIKETETEQSCPLCSTKNVRETRDHHKEGETLYTLYRCDMCGVEHWKPFSNPGATWYAHDERYADRNRSPFLKPNKKHTDVLNFFKETKGKVLDVGCGTGNFLVHAREKGWNTWGIDFDPDAVLAAKTVFGLSNVSAETLSEFRKRFPNERFTLVTFFDVLEHLDNHDEFMDDVTQLLTEKGCLGLSVPYRHAWRWLIPHDLPPRHLTRWDERSLTEFLRRYGFTIRYMNRLPASFYYIVLKLKFNFGGWSSVGLISKVKKQGGGGRISSLRIRALHVLAKTKDIVLFGIPALLIYLALLLSRKRYTDMYVVAQKD